MRQLQVRAFAYTIIVPGITLIDMCEQIENMTRTLVVENGLEVYRQMHDVHHCASYPISPCMSNCGLDVAYSVGGDRLPHRMLH